MKLFTKQCILIAAAVWLLIVINTGCSTNRSLYGGANKPALLSAKKLPTFNYTDPASSNYYLKVYDGAVDKELARNQILNDLMGMIDVNYYDFETNLRSDKGVQELGTDIATLGLTAAATVVGAAETKTILSAIATGVIGVNASIDKEVFQNNTVQALQLQMRSMRAEVEKNLNAGMGETITKYPLQNGIRDTVAYYYAGSLTDALIGLVQTSGNDAKNNQNAANAARK